jgi:hypothetical protein
MVSWIMVIQYDASINVGSEVYASWGATSLGGQKIELGKAKWQRNADAKTKKENLAPPF